MLYKRFDKELYDKYDNFGRDIVKKFVLENFSLTAVDNSDRYGVDLLLKDSEDTLQGYAEVEVRHNWKDLAFPYDTVNVPYRKLKLLKNSLETKFFSINLTGKALLYCSGETVLESSVEESRNKYMRSGEYFFKVPLEKMTYVVL